MTRKERAVDNLRNIVLKRYSRVGVKLTPELANNIWNDLLGEYERNGHDAALEKALNSKLNPQLVKNH